MQWSNIQVADWIVKVGFAEHKKAFVKKVDGLALLLTTSADLKELDIDV